MNNNNNNNHHGSIHKRPSKLKKRRKRGLVDDTAQTTPSFRRDAHTTVTSDHDLNLTNTKSKVVNDTGLYEGIVQSTGKEFGSDDDNDDNDCGVTLGCSTTSSRGTTSVIINPYLKKKDDESSHVKSKSTSNINNKSSSSRRDLNQQENSFLQFVATKKKPKNSHDTTSCDLSTSCHDERNKETNISSSSKKRWQHQQYLDHDTSIVINSSEDSNNKEIFAIRNRDDASSKNNDHPRKNPTIVPTSNELSMKSNRDSTSVPTFYRTPFEILQIPTTTITYSASSLHNQENTTRRRKSYLEAEEKFCQTYYDTVYYSLLVEHYIRNDCDHDRDTIQNDKGIIQSGKEVCIDHQDRKMVVYDHPILGNVNLKLMNNNDIVDIEISKTSSSSPLPSNKIRHNHRNFLAFPKPLVVEHQHQHQPFMTKNHKIENHLLGSNIAIESLFFPTMKSIHQSHDINRELQTRRRTNLPMHMKTSGRLKIVCYQGATVRSHYNIDSNAITTLDSSSLSSSNMKTNKKVCKLSKDDEREFVDVKWLSPYHYSTLCSTSKNDCMLMQESTSEDDEEGEEAAVQDLNLNGVFRYKIKLLDEDLLQNDDSNEIGATKEKFGWISDRSRLKDNPYWIAITL